MLKFIRRLILSLGVIVLLLFAGVTYTGYYYLDAIAARLIGPKIAAPAVKKQPPADADEAALLEELHKEDDEPVPQLPAPPRESQVDLLDYYDHILETKTHTPHKPLCEILCDRTRFFAGRDELALQNIKDFFERDHNAEKSFNDPTFRIALTNLTLTTDLFPKPIREIVLDIEKVESMTSWQKMIFVFNSEIEIAKFVVYVKSHQKENRQLKKQLEEIHKLQKQCSSKNKAATFELCAALNTANW